MNYPKVLIISHNCFSASGSNGRTLNNFFSGYPRENLAQFYIYNEEPTLDICDNYYRVTDKEALLSVIKRKGGNKIEKKNNKDDVHINDVSSYRKPKKTPLIYLVRELFWTIGGWKKNSEAWIDDFAPDVVLFQAGDASFLFDLAYRTAKKRGIPLVIYNSESYYFKNKNFLQSSPASDFWYMILHRRFRKSVKKAIGYAASSIYISDSLKKLYDDEFNMPSETIMTSTSLSESCDVIKKSEDIKISYLGNLGVGRYETLISLVEIIREINEEYCIDVYGKASQDIIEILEKTPGINYCGFVSYDACVCIMKESTILVHIENFSDFYMEDSKYAFSTKIADSLACGTCLFVYAPREMSVTEYLLGNGAACVACNKNEASEKLKKLLSDPEARKKYELCGIKVAKENHSIDRNRQKFWDVLNKAIES